MDKQIRDLSAIVTPQDTDVFEVDDATSAETLKETRAQLRTSMQIETDALPIDATPQFESLVRTNRGGTEYQITAQQMKDLIAPNTNALPPDSFPDPTNDVVRVNAGGVESFIVMQDLLKQPYRTATISIENPQVGYAGSLEIPFDCIIFGWTIMTAGGSLATCEVDVKKEPYATFDPPLVLGDSLIYIGGTTEKPKLTNEKKNQLLTLTQWEVLVYQGDILSFYIESCSTLAENLIIQIRLRPTVVL